MASIKLAPGVLNPPACYETEQQRFEAYVAKIIATILGGLQWEFQTGAPVDLGLYWLRRGSDGRPLGGRQYVVADGRWEPWLEVPIVVESSGGVANTYTATTGNSLTSGAVIIPGRRVLFIAAATNTGASTLNVDGTGAVDITRHNAASLIAGDLAAGAIVDVVYNSTGGGRWELQTPVPPSVATAPTYPPGMTGAVPAAGAVTTLAHGQGKKPDFVDARLVCTSADRGFSAGDELNFNSCFWSGANTGIPAFGIGRDANNVTVMRASEAVVVFTVAKTGGTSYSAGAADQLDLTKWTLKVNCIFLP